jgi:hypothetical protein
MLASKEVKAEKKYGVQYAKAVWSRYLYADYSIYNKIARFVDNRKYAEGLQSIDKFKDLMDLKGDTSYLNLDWQSISVIPKFVNLIVGEMTNLEYKVQANALDESSMKKYDEEKRKIYANMLMQDFSKKLEEQTGLSMIDKTAPVPKDKEDADIFIDTTLKQATEVAMEVCIKFVMDSNQFNSKIKERLIRDLVVLKMCATREYFDENDDIKLRYVDPANLVVPYTKDPYFSDLEYTGEVLKMSFHELRELAGDQFTEEEYAEMAEMLGSGAGNSNTSLREENGRYYNNGYSGSNRNDDFYIKVLDFEYRSNNHKDTYEKKYRDDKNYFQKKKPNGYQPKKYSKGKREVFTSPNYQVFYEGLWIVGTDYIFDYGLQKNMKRPKKGGAYSSECKSRYNITAPNIYDGENKSLVESMIPLDDQMTLAHLKLQQALAKARPSGIAVDVGALEEVMYGRGENFIDPLEVQQIFDQTGNLYYRSESLETEGGFYNQKPIQELANGLHQSALYYVEIRNSNLQAIREITGINEFRDGTQPDSKTLVGVQKASISMSRNSSRFLNEAFLYVYNQTAKGIALMVQLKAVADDLKGYEYALGRESIDILNVTKDLSFAEMGIEIVALPDAEERAYLDTLIERALTAGSIEMEDAMEVRDVAKVNIKKATHLLKRSRKEKEEQDMKKTQFASQQNAQSQTQSAMAVKQAEMEMKQMDHQMKMQELQMEYQLKMELAKVEGRIKGEVEMVKGDEKLQQIELGMSGNLDDTQAKGGASLPPTFSVPPGMSKESLD